MKTKTQKIDICYRCNLFHESCYGEQFKWATRTDGKRKQDCTHRVCDRDNIASPIQIQAFYSLYRVKRKGGTDKMMAFTEAIVQTSDDVYDAALQKNPEMVEEYYRAKNQKGQKRIRKHEGIE